MRYLISLLAVVALVAGVLLIGLGQGEPADTGLQGGIEAPAARAEQGDAPLSGEVVRGDDDEAARTAAAGPVASPGETGEASEGSAELSGPARLRGRVVDGSGAPIAGARVALNPPARGLVVGDVERTLLDETESGGDGSFSFERVAGAVELAIEAERFAPYSEEVELHAGATFDLGEVRLDTGVLLVGRVLDADGAPVAGVRVLREDSAPAGVLMGAPVAVTIAVSDAGGAFRVVSQAVGPWRLRFASDAHPDGTLEGMTELPGTVVDDLVITLERGASIEGRVLEVPADIAFDVRAVPAVGMEDRVEFDLAGPSGERRATLLDDGRFAVRGLSPNKRYRLTLNSSERGTGASFGDASHATPVFAAAGARGVELRYSAGSSLLLRVVDATTAEPLEHFTAEGGFEWPMPLTDADGQLRRVHPDGRVRFDGLRPRAGRASMRVSIAAAGYEIFERDGIALTPEDELDLGTVRLNRMSVIRVLVRDSLTRAPIVGARVEARTAVPPDGRRVRIRAGGSTDAPDVRYGTSDESGLALVSSFPGKTVRLTVRADGFGPWRLDALELPAAGDFEQDVLLDLGARVTVRVVDPLGAPAPRKRVEHHAPFGVEEGAEAPSPRERAADATGTLVYTLLEPGTHRFRVAPEVRGVMTFDLGNGPSGPGWRTLEVEPGGVHELVLELPRQARLLGRLTEDGDPLPGATFALFDADGDPLQRSLARMTGGGHRGRSDSGGRFAIEGLTPGRWLVEISHPARAMPFETELRLEEGGNVEDIALPVTVVETRVTDAQGEPVHGAAVRAKRAGGRTERARVMVATVDRGAGQTSFRMGGDEPAAPVFTDEDGRARLRGVTPDVSCVIEASAQGFETGRSETFEVPLDGVREGVEIVLAPGGSIVVEVRDARGDPVPGGYIASVVWRGASSGAANEPKLAPVQEGRARFDDLSTGKWEVRLREMTEGDPAGAGSQDPREVEVQPGASETVSFTVN